MRPALLIVFSHLRWGFVYRRPQQLLSRLAGRWHVLFIEQPVHDPGVAWLEEQLLDKHLSVLVPHTPLTAPGFHDDQLWLLQALLVRYLRRSAQQVDAAWLYTPLALPLVHRLRPRCIVYDCMEPPAAPGAPRQLLQREAALLEQAALVLTAGPSLYEARREQHAQVICLPSAVDAAHYAPDRLRVHDAQARQAHALQGSLPAPRLGYFGVIDERLDAELLALLADTHPEWTLVMVGPVTHSDPASLPRRPNIHWLGLQPYARLPYLLAGWDLCLLPFVLSPSTRFLSPTKTLEYMAGGKPVVSTPVHDVAWLYSDAVAIAMRGQPFIEACETLLSEGPAARSRRALHMLAAVSANSWDRSAQAVHELLSRALADADATQRSVPLLTAP